jgi:hypothetical protein
VQEVRNFDLHKNRPIVLLLSCEGSAWGNSAVSSSLARALKQSGAMAVWSYTQKADAGEASAAAVQFLEEIWRGKTPFETFRSMTRDRTIKTGPKVHLKVQIQLFSMPSCVKKCSERLEISSRAWRTAIRQAAFSSGTGPC